MRNMRGRWTRKRERVREAMTSDLEEECIVFGINEFFFANGPKFLEQFLHTGMLCLSDTELTQAQVDR